MNLLWIYAHPGQRSLNAALRDEGLRAARDAGHTVVLSDLYAMSWKPTLDHGDFGDIPGPPSEVSRASEHAYEAGTLADDIQKEQAKLVAADGIVIQFPLWWYSTPAILKGWFDRVFTKGFAYGLRDPDHPGRTFRYGDGPLQGRIAQVVVTTGSPAAPMGPRGINGQLDQVLFPLLHGTLWYVGMDVLPPLAVHSADRLTGGDYAQAASAVRHRVTHLQEVAPIPYRRQNGGDYDDDLVLSRDLATSQSGLAVHARA